MLCCSSLVSASVQLFPLPLHTLTKYTTSCGVFVHCFPVLFGIAHLSGSVAFPPPSSLFEHTTALFCPVPVYPKAVGEPGALFRHISKVRLLGFDSTPAGPLTTTCQVYVPSPARVRSKYVLLSPLMVSLATVVLPSFVASTV